MIGCTHQRSFNRKADLERHQREVHDSQSNRNDFLCTHPGCKRSLLGKGFSRKENLADHLKRIHKNTELNAGNNTDLRSPQSSTLLLPDRKLPTPGVQSPPSQLPHLSPIPHSWPEEVYHTGQKRRRQDEREGDEGNELSHELSQQTSLDETPSTNTKIKRLNQLIEDQNRRLIEKDTQLAEKDKELSSKDAQLALLQGLVERAMNGRNLLS